MTTALFPFEAGGAWFAVRADAVAEVHETVPVTRLPFAPPHVCGIANVSGRLLPVVDLAGYPGLGLDQRTPPPLLVVVTAGDGTIAIRARRVGGALWAAAMDGAGPAPVVARVSGDDRAIAVLDLGLIELGHGMGFAESGAGRAMLGAPALPARAERDDVERLLAVEAGSRGFALEMAGLLLVFAVTDLRPLPHAPPQVHGVSRALRRPVLLVDALDRDGAGAPPYAVVVATANGPVGIGVDAVRGVVRVPAGRRRERETTSAPGGQIVEHDGRWLEVRSGTTMVDERMDQIGRLIPATGVAGSDGGLLERRAWRRFLTLRVGDRLFALAFEQVRRVVEPPAAHRLPGEGHGFDGITGVDGSILPLVDLRRLLGGDPARPAGAAVLVESGGGIVALVVDEVQRIRKVAEDDVDPLSDPFTAAVIQAEGAFLPVLRADGLLAAVSA